MKIHAIHLNHLLDYAQVQNLPVDNLLSSIGKTADELIQPAATISSEEFYTVLQLIDQSLNDRLWSIRAGRFLHLKLLGIIHLISLEAATIHEALFYLQQYMDAGFPLLTTTTKQGEEKTAIELSIPFNNNPLNRLILENILTIISRELVIMGINEDELLLESPFRNEEYPDQWNYGHQFSIQFTSAELKAALKSTALLQLDQLIPQYLKLIEDLKKESLFSSQVKITCLSLASPALPELQQVANTLFITPRTFQRRLKSEFTNFRKLTDELKQEISTVLIYNKRYSVTDISYILGYSEPAAFIHSFKKWYGETPEQHRNRLLVT